VVTISESLAKGDDAASFASAQQTTFLTLLPLLFIGVAVALLAPRAGAAKASGPAAGVTSKTVA
jgi:hypothetical protein